MNIIGNVNKPNNTIIIEGSQIREQRGVESKPLELKAGSTIQGTVMSISDTAEGKVANINVGDYVISAKLQEGMGLREGQTLNFAIRGSGASGVSITPLYENTSIDQSTLKALTAAGIEINNDTVQMVKDMMEAGLSIGKESLLEMNRNLSAHPDTSISTMVEMKSLNIPITDNNIVQFQNYKNYEHQVTSAMEDIMDELPKAFDQLTQAGNTTAALNLYGSVLKLFGEGAEQSVNAETQATESQMQQTGEPIAAQNEQAAESGTVTSEGKEIPAQVNASEEQALQIKGSEAEKNPENAAKASGEIPEKTAQLQEKPVLSDNFVNNLKNLGISDKTISKYEAALKELNGQSEDFNGTQATSPKLEQAQKELLKELADNFSKSDLTDVAESASWKNVFKSDDYNKLLKGNITSQWLLKPGDVQNKENIENLYQRLGNQVKSLSNAINQTLGPESSLAQTTNNLQNNLDFMNQLNQMFQYVQLPLQMAGQNAHGDLYVYKNKHKKMSEDGSVSAILHLDMDNLGPLDVYVKLVQNKVTTNFYVADDSVIELINDNIHILNERLEKRGYSMNVNVMLHDDMDGQDAAVDEMLDVMKTPILSTQSFDARA
ncbi:flagellar hook-length control protein FliK [Butyrivibrio sp. AE2032]|uniref:flagellar hook-length control protein FliK n=1 Tax=Butyrivibrio sp. AE2032 TaxID=1458463 RepID=UPI00054EF583|nr:flagellar hook-length control protein FliK [Butyrivibrio sp. AE2032]